MISLINKMYMKSLDLEWIFRWKQNTEWGVTLKSNVIKKEIDIYYYDLDRICRAFH